MASYYLIGEHLAHSCSAELHRSFGRYDYELRELGPEELEPFLKSRGFSGLNVTIPYKEAVIPYLDRLEERAAAIGAVNTIVNRGGVLWGYNTDFGGMEAALSRLARVGRAESTGKPSFLAGKKVLILGSGGSAKTALALCHELGAGVCLLVSRSGQPGAISYAEAVRAHQDAAWILNCTPVGMYPDQEDSPLMLGQRAPISPKDLTDGAGGLGEAGLSFPLLEGVFDCVYNPLRTRLVLAAQKLGLPADGGLYMLVKQAALACELFTGTSVIEAQTELAYKTLRRRQENLVLIGMPGAGKTTVGRLLAEKTGKSFVDLDEAIVRRAGKSIPAIFAESGEAVFRDMESDLIQALSENGGQVIATGGGAILREENVIRLRQNGRLIFLDRTLSALKPTADRPLGDTVEKLQQLYQTRYPIYCSAADLVIDASPSPDKIATALAAMVRGQVTRDK